jgi:hypothetical protein
VSSDWTRFLGRKYDSDVACWAFVRDYYSEALGIELPDYAAQAVGPLESAELSRLVTEYGDGWQLAETPEAGDVARFWVRRPASPEHVGIYLGENRILHAPKANQGVHVVDLARDEWARRLVDYRRYAPETWRLEAFPDPLSSVRVSMDVPCGVTLMDALLLAGVKRDREGYIRVCIGNVPVAPAMLRHCRPKAGVLVSARSVPGVSVLVAIAAAVAAVVPGAATIGAVVGGTAFAALGLSSATAAVAFAAAGTIIAGVGILAGLAGIVSLVMPSAPNSASTSSIGPGASPAANGVGNRIDRFGPVPVLLGKMRVFPPLFALPFTEIVGSDRFWRLGLVVSASRCKIDHTDELGRTGIEIGGVPIEEIPGADWDIVQGGEIPPDVTLEEEIVDEVTTEGPAPRGLWKLDDAAAPMTNEIGGGVSLLAHGTPVYQQPPIFQRASEFSVLTTASSALYTDAAPISDWDATDWTVMFGAEIPVSATSGVLFEIGDDTEGMRLVRVAGGGFRAVTETPSDGVRFVDLAAEYFRGVRSISIVKSGDKVEVYSDGLLMQRTTLRVVPLNTQKITLGAGRSGASFVDFVPASIQDFAMWDRALTRDTIRTLAEAAITRFDAVPIPLRRGPPIRLLGDTVTEVQVNSNQQHPIAPEGDYVVRDWVTREIVGPGIELGVDIFFPQGLWRLEINSKAPSRRPASVGFQIQYRVSGTDEWLNASDAPILGRLEELDTQKEVRWEIMPGLSGTTPGTSTPDALPAFRIWGDTQQPILQGFRWHVFENQRFEVRLRQFTTEPSNNRAGQSDVPAFSGDFQILSYRAIARNESPLRGRNADTWALVTLSLPIAEVGNTVEQISVLGTSIFRERDGGGWSAERPTRNAASLALAALQNRALTPKPLADTAMDLASWDGFTTRALPTDLYVDFVGNAFDLANAVLAPSFASIGFRERMGVVEDRAGMTPVQLLTSRDMQGFRWTSRILGLPDGLRVKFLDAEQHYQQSEVLVFQDGITEDTAQTYGTVDLLGVTDRTRAIANQKKQLRMAAARHIEFSGTVWLSHLNAMRGDVVEFQHHLALVGLRAARIIAVTLSGPGTHVVSVKTDEIIPFNGALTYGTRWRRVVSGAVVLAGGDIANPATASNTLTFTTPVLLADAPAVDDLIVVGERGIETQQCLVRDMAHRSIGGIPAADVVLIPYAPTVHNAVDDMPDFTPVVSRPGGVPALQSPNVPHVLRIVSDESVMRATSVGLLPRMAVYARPSPGLGASPSHMQARAIVLNDDGIPRGAWQVSDYVAVGGLAKMLIDDVLETRSYRVQVRAISAASVASDWSPPTEHVVIGSTTRPPDVEDLRREGDVLRWSLPTVPLDIDGFQIRTARGALSTIPWDTATPVHAGVWKTSSFPVSELRGSGPITVLVRAVDISGRLSVTPAVLVTELPRRSLNVFAEVDYRALGWPGTITGGAVSGGNLVATLTAGDDTQLAWPGEDTQEAWPGSDTQTAWGSQSSDMTYVDEFVPSALLLDKLVNFDIDWSPVDTVGTIEYRELGPQDAWPGSDADLAWPGSDADPAWPEPEWSAWRPWPGELSFAARKPYEFRVSFPSQQRAVVFSGMTMRIDVDDRREIVNNPPLSTAGSRLPLSSSFTAIRLVLPTREQATGDTSVRIEVVDMQPFGPLVIARDGSDNAVASGAWDFEVIGY